MEILARNFLYAPRDEGTALFAADMTAKTMEKELCNKIDYE
jgi:hypothetical protein